MSVSTALWVALSAFVLVLAYKGVSACQRANVADWGSRTLNLLDGLNRLFCRNFHRFQHDPLALPETGAAIVACNHISGLDPLLMAAASPRPLRYLIAKEEYERWWLRWLYQSMRCIPVDRSRNPEQAFYVARQALANGDVLAIFPQGAIRSVDAPRQALKRGVIVLADMGQAPIIPVRVSGIAGAGKVLGAVWLRSAARLDAGKALRVNGRKDLETLHKLEDFLVASPGRRQKIRDKHQRGTR